MTPESTKEVRKVLTLLERDLVQWQAAILMP